MASGHLFPQTPTSAPPAPFPIRRTSTTHRTDVGFAADDGFPLSGTLYMRPGGDGPVVLVSSAAAVRRRHYAGFADALLDTGASAVLTYDFRGVCDSRVPAGWNARVNMKDWGVRDMAAAAEVLQSRFPDRDLVGVGQSIGGTMLGLCPAAARFRRYALVASANGYLGLTNEAVRLFLSMNLIGIPVSRLLGKAPGWLGIGETIPGSVFRDWARWCRRRGFLFDDPRLPEARGFAEVATPLLSVGLTDDRWSTLRATRAMLERFSGAPRAELWFSPKEAGVERIGHLGFFKTKFSAALWPPVLSWLVRGQFQAAS